MMMEREEFLGRAQQLRRRIDEASEAWGPVEICAVTKNHDAQTANLAFEAGIRTIGENRVQELTEKKPFLRPEYRIHLIGRLQTNKVRSVISQVDMVESLDRDSLAEELNRQAVKNGIVMPALVQVNIAREPQKGGVDEDQLIPFLKRVSALEGISVRGLMAIMPLSDDPEQVRGYFRSMRRWFDHLREHPVGGVAMQTLSMGMSRDCIVAAQEGATMVRLGTALFGARAPRQDG